MRPLGFRFDVDAVIIDGTAHRTSCVLLTTVLAERAVRIQAGEVYASERCPRVCPCAPPFETLLGYQLRASVGSV
jgi:hypothetical protein